MEDDYRAADHSGSESVGTLRVRVDEVDRALVHLLNERARIVQEIAAVKREAGIPPFDPGREEKLLRKVVEENGGPIYDSSMRKIFELILHHIRDLAYVSHPPAR